MIVYELRNGGIEQVTVHLEIAKFLKFIASELKRASIDIISVIVAKTWIIYQIYQGLF